MDISHPFRPRVVVVVVVVVVVSTEVATTAPARAGDAIHPVRVTVRGTRSRSRRRRDAERTRETVEDDECVEEKNVHAFVARRRGDSREDDRRGTIDDASRFRHHARVEAVVTREGGTKSLIFVG